MLAELDLQKTVASPRQPKPQLSYGQRLSLKIRGRVFLRYEVRDDWIRPLPIYAANCDRHGVYEDYPHGWNEKLECPLCLLKRIGKGR